MPLAKWSVAGVVVLAALPWLGAEAVAQDRFLGDVTESASQKAAASGAGVGGLFDDIAAARNEPQDKVVGPGARATPAGFFRDAVAIEAPGRGICSGVLISKRMVLTAGHCICNLGLTRQVAINKRTEARIIIGESTAQEDQQGNLRVASVETFEPNFCANGMRGLDLALIHLYPPDADLLLFQRQFAPRFAGAGVAATRLIATGLYLSGVNALTVVGFGRNNQNTSGIKNHAVVPVASLICGTPLARTRYGCRPGEEVVLSGTDADTCSGDSGGPAYVVIGHNYYLAGITSRAIDWRGRCGPGGIYSLVTPAVVRWLREKSARNGEEIFALE